MNTTDLNLFFFDELKKLDCNYTTKAYIVNMLCRFNHSTTDLSKESITLLYAQAKYRQDFNIFDNIGSWIFFCNTFYPEHLNNASQDYYYSIGKSSYYSCYNIINRKWKLYKELSERFAELSEDMRKIFIRKNQNHTYIFETSSEILHKPKQN